MAELSDKFCSGDTSKQLSQDLTAKDISSSANKDYTFSFKLDPGDGCKTDCAAAFKAMANKYIPTLLSSPVYLYLLILSTTQAKA